MSDNREQITLNNEQRAAAEYEKNVVVAAGAGSGKTSVLANRYASLVTGDRRLTVEQILTLTFTRKAAAEMYQRIYSTLSLIAEHGRGEKQKLAQKAVEDFFHARIQTLDSYSSGLVRQGSVRYGISPEFSLDEERCRSLAREEALPFLIAHRRHPAIEQLYRRKRPPNSRNGYSVPADIAERFFASTVFMYGNIDDPPGFAEHTRRQFGIIITEWDKIIKLVQTRFGELKDIVSGDDKNDKLIKQIEPMIRRLDCGEIKFPGSGEIENFFDTLITLPDSECVPKAENHPVRQKLLQCLVFMNGFHDDLDLRYGKRDSHAKKIVNELRNNFGLFSSLAVFCIQAGVILSLMALLDKFRNIFLEKKRAEGILTYSDAARLARTILKDHPDIRQSEKETFKAIMIDEFQDNNKLQKDMLFLLAEDEERQEKSVPGAKDLLDDKLFFVGDEKQSVYRFRGADVSVFRGLQEELAGGVLHLKTNYRSSPALIGAFNAVFGGSEFDPEGFRPSGIFPSVFVRGTDNPASVPPYEALYTPLSPGTDRVGGLTLCLFDKSGSAKEQDGEDGETPEAEEMGGVENEALFTAERIRQLLGEKDGKGSARYRPDDIAILFRSHSPQKLFEKHLRLLDIPYSGEGGINGFFSDGPVNDIVAVLRLAAYPLDSEAYAVTLRSPFAGLSLQGTAVCIAAFNRAKAEAFREKDREAAPFSGEDAGQLSETDREKFLYGQKLYRKIRGAASEKTIAETISCLWYDEGYRYETEWNPQTTVYRELYDYLFALAVQADADGKSLAAFTDYLRDLRDSGGRLEDMDIPLERSGAVRLMTIHKSKGLEFPVVFLVCCGNRGRQASGDADIYETEEGGLSCNPPLPPECSLMGKVRRNFFYEKSRAEEKRKRTAELRRLLYVAMTRAERELFITGALALGESKETAPDGNLPRRLKTAVEKKLSGQAENDRKNGTARIPGDSVIDNDTFLGLLLPAITARIPDEGAEEREQFFKLESIPVYTDEHIKSREHQGAVYFNDQKGLSRFLSDIAPRYEKAAVLSMPVIPSPYRTPTSFRAYAEEDSDSAGMQTGWRFDSGNSGESATDIFGRVDSTLARFSAAGREEDIFSAANFGTVAHACVESLLNGEDPAIPPKFAGSLGLTEAETLLAAGRTIAERFIRSPLGKKAAAAMRKSEYCFRTLCKDSEGKTVFINGTIDLFFEDADTLHVVDFKTDSRENPAEHIPQMSFYCRAASELRRKPCRLWLYYLRTGRAVEVTEAATKGLPAGLET
ncbi:MAG: UvrD-helicase domain-containing protein [Treponema sp.]|jgi:ATP-dependent helicase/nuclease subunit A|nr:UvrD-helicase domain-containing protein [Treponema sp.]